MLFQAIFDEFMERREWWEMLLRRLLYLLSSSSLVSLQENLRHTFNSALHTKMKYKQENQSVFCFWWRRRRALWTCPPPSGVTRDTDNQSLSRTRSRNTSLSQRRWRMNRYEDTRKMYTKQDGFQSFFSRSCLFFDTLLLKPVLSSRRKRRDVDDADCFWVTASSSAVEEAVFSQVSGSLRFPLGT